MRLTLASETIGRTGGITGSGARKVLGAPHIDSLEVVIREAVQNSWDARERTSIQFGVVGFEFAGEQKTALLEALRDGTTGADRIFRLPDAGPLDALLLWDRGTSGLGGNVRADESEDGERDFVRFVYMIGDTKAQTEVQATGGTYGFGRSSFITASRVGTVLVHTACLHRRERQSRVIGMTWSDPDRSNRRLTGRHWWGRPDGEHVLPLIGRDADRLASTLGLNPLGDQELGTSILILLPRWSALDEQVEPARERALSQIQAGLLWNCWPRLMDGSIRASVRWFGRDIPIPDPRRHPRLRPFTQAYEVSAKAEAPRGMFLGALSSIKPSKALGTLALVQAPFAPLSDDNENGDEVRSSAGPLHHVALMRGTRLVVRYLEGPVPPEGLQYAGVFLAHEDVDGTFARSEPPAHDDWVKERLSGHERTFVSVTFRRISDAIRGFLQPGGDSPEGGGDSGDLGLLSDRLGRLLTDVEGDGADDNTDGGGGGGGGEGGGSSRRRVAVSVLTPARRARGNHVELRIPVQVSTRQRRPVSVKLSARAVVVVEGGAEKQPPAGAALPEVLGWQHSADAALVESPSLKVEVDGQRELYLTVLQPRDCLVKLVVDAE